MILYSVVTCIVELKQNHRIRFNDIGDKKIVPNDGTPFVLMGRQLMSCHYGPDRHTADKCKREEERQKELKVNIHVVTLMFSLKVEFNDSCE